MKFSHTYDKNCKVRATSSHQRGANLYTEKKDAISHSAWAKSESESIISFGPTQENNQFFYESWKADGINKLSFGNKTLYNLKSYGKFGLGLPRRSGFWEYASYDNYVLTVNNVNKIPLRGISAFSKLLPYQGLTTNCVNVASLGAWASGIPNIGIHPFLFHGYMNLYTQGMRPELFSYHLSLYSF